MKFSLGTNWNSKLLSQIAKLNSQNEDKIFEFFGSLPLSIFGHARQTTKIPNISKELAEKSIRDIKKNGIQFNYLVNSSIFPCLDSQEKLDKALEYFSWIEEQGVDIVTIGSEETLSFVSEHFPEIAINLSIVMAIKSHREAERLYKKFPKIKRITPHQSINRDKEELALIIETSHKYGVEVELLANEICVYTCPKMKEHYIFLSKITQSEKALNIKPIRWCQQINVKDKLSFLNACWIRPEDVELYENLGVDILKICGRGESTEYLTKTASAYLYGKFEGNALDLFYQSSYQYFQSKEDIPYYDNQKLNGFIEYLWKNGLKKAEQIPEKYNLA